MDLNAFENRENDWIRDLSTIERERERKRVGTTKNQTTNKTDKSIDDDRRWKKSRVPSNNFLEWQIGFTLEISLSFFLLFFFLCGERKLKYTKGQRKEKESS